MLSFRSQMLMKSRCSAGKIALVRKIYTQVLLTGVEIRTSNNTHQRRQWQPTLVLLSGKSMDGGALQAAVHGVARSQTRLSDFTFTFHFHALEKEMATHSSVLAWRIPGMGEPGGLPSRGRTESDTTEATQQQQQQHSHAHLKMYS